MFPAPMNPIVIFFNPSYSRPDSLSTSTLATDGRIPMGQRLATADRRLDWRPDCRLATGDLTGDCRPSTIDCLYAPNRLFGLAVPSLARQFLSGRSAPAALAGTL